MNLKNLTNEAFEKDIFGAPTFVVNNKFFWGQDRLDYALEEYQFLNYFKFTLFNCSKTTINM